MSLLRGMKLVIKGQVITCTYKKGMLFVGMESSMLHWYMMKTVHFTAL